MADFLATNDFAGTGAVMQVEINFAGVRLDLPDQPNPYLEDDDVKAVIITPATPTSVETQVPVALVKINDNTFTTAPTVVDLTKVLRVYRDTDIEFPIVDFVSLQVVSESDLDNQARQTLYAVMESRDNAAIAIDQANAASATAVAANITAAEALVVAEDAVVTADAATVTANQALATANASDIKSDQALAAAASAEDHATAADVAAAAAQVAATAAQDAAVIAVADSAEALSVANSIDAKAQSALDTSAAAAATADNALSVANAIDAKAQEALDDAEAAQAAAAAAVATANAIDAKAQLALDNSELAQDDAAAALSVANAANVTAGNALTVANSKQASDPTLTAIAATTLAANKLIYGTGTETAALADLTATGRDIIAKATAVEFKQAYGIVGRNMIINGDCRIQQRLDASVTGAATLYGGPDRFACTNASAGGTLRQYAAVIAENGILHRCIAQRADGTLTDLSGTRYWSGIQQFIEGNNCFHAKNSAMTISFVFLASVTGTYSVSLRTNTAPAKSIVFQFNVPVANVAQRVSFSVPPPPSDTVIDAGTGIGLILMIGAQNNVTYSTNTLDVWQSGTYICAPTTNWGATLNAVIAATLIQVEIGAQSSFEALEYSTVLTQCLRYYEVIAGTVNIEQGRYVHRYWKVYKRVVPTVAIIGGSVQGANIDVVGGQGIRVPGGTLPSTDSDFSIAGSAEL